ncbi:hypothetical protein D3C81_971460 [compost metagenome]
MRLISRSVSASTLSRAASASTRSRLSTVTAVQLDSPPRYVLRLYWKRSALSNGSRICGLAAPRITGRLNEGFSALNSSSGMLASLAASATSMSREVVTVTKYG